MRKRRVSITGANGQLGRALVTLFEPTHTIHAIVKSDVDILHWNSVRDSLAAFGPDLVVHAAAMTDVDGCESDPHAAFAVNALGTRHVGRAAAMIGAEIVYVSTNYVFDGSKPGPYHEFDSTLPLSVYGTSKLAGEVEAMSATHRCHVVRTSWLYAENGHNFVRTMRRLMAERDRLTVVADQRGNPTFAVDLAGAIKEIVERAGYGIHHVVNSGEASWYEWATEIAALTNAPTVIEPIPASAWPRPAKPPMNGTMFSLSMPDVGISLPDWRDGLRRCIFG